MSAGKPSAFGGRRNLPPDWAKRKQQTHDRDGWRCTATLPSGKRCPRGRGTGHALQCDHVGDRNDHSLANLTSLCEKHHADKTAQQGVAARAKKKQGRIRREERHPGLVRRPEDGAR